MCQSTVSREDYRALQERIRAQQPKCCPNCQDDSSFCPSFVDDSFQCGACGWVWMVDR